MPSDSRRVSGQVTSEGGVVAYQRTWRNGWGALTWFSKSKTQGNAVGFEVTKTGDDK